MATRVLQIPYPEDLPKLLGETPEQFEQELRFLVPAKLYELGRISSGWAAKLAGMERVEFLESLSKYQVSAFNYSKAELERELRDAKGRANKGI